MGSPVSRSSPALLTPVRSHLRMEGSPAGSSHLSPGGTHGLLDRILERKRAALVDLNGVADAPSRRRAREDDPQENPEDKVAVQRFTIVSRGAPPAKRQKAEHGVLLAPPRVAAQLGGEVQVCRCSECDKNGVRRRMSGTRRCRRDTESHPEYALLLAMIEHFEAECLDRVGQSELISEACCREKSAYFILGPGSTAVGYVGAELESNRRVRRTVESMSDAGDLAAGDDKVPTILQLFVEPEFRGQGYASEALGLLLRDHDMVRVDDPAPVLLRILGRLGFSAMGKQEGMDGRPLVTLSREFCVNV